MKDIVQNRNRKCEETVGIDQNRNLLINKIRGRQEQGTESVVRHVCVT